VNEPADDPPPGFGYRLLALLLYPLWLGHALLHGRNHALAQYAALRRSRYAADDLPRIWVHASSVGEVRAAAALVEALLARGDDILFTSFTASGYQAIQRDFGDRLASTVIPIDCAWHCRRFFGSYRIRLALVMETELWPELLYQARRQGIELLLINARLSEKSLRRNRFLRALLGRTLGYFAQILTRNRGDREALLRLGAKADDIRILGNLKAHSAAARAAPARIVARDYLLLASSHGGEEQDLLATRPAAPQQLLLVIAPRHPARSERLQTLFQQMGLRYAVRSQQQPVEADTEVYLADTLGELKALMAHARVVIMGGSFDDTGGHNLIEAASLGCIIVTGPSDGNIRDDIEMLGNGQGIIQVDDAAACWQAVASLLEQPERAQALAREARARLARQPDVLQAYLEAITPRL
jgi:3-deoxy-D-manno-octulosonic-acid transferase